MVIEKTRDFRPAIENRLNFTCAFVTLRATKNINAMEID